MTEQAIPSTPTALAEFNYPQIQRDMLVRRIGKIAFYFNPIVAYFFLWAPILILVLFSFNASSSVSSWGGISTQWYTKILGEYREPVHQRDAARPPEHLVHWYRLDADLNYHRYNGGDGAGTRQLPRQECH